MKKIFSKIFTAKKKSRELEIPSIQTSPLSEDQINSESLDSPTFRPIQLLVGCGQSVGMQRDHNEDTLFCMSSVIADGKNDLPLGLLIVADGMGGHRNGAVASNVAVRGVAKSLIKKVYSHVLDFEKDPLKDSLQEIMNHAIQDAHKLIIQEAPGGGTTFTCALILGEQVTIGHIGDSRAYFIHADGQIQKITKDHSLVQRMVELEEITEAEAAIHPNRNVLLKALGQTENASPDIYTLPFPNKSHLLICSDGLWGVVPENELLCLLSNGDDPVITCSRMVEVTNAHGGPDNISVILAQRFG